MPDRKDKFTTFEDAYEYLVQFDQHQIPTLHGEITIQVKPNTGKYPGKIGSSTLTCTTDKLREEYHIGEPGHTRSGLIKVVYTPRQVHQTLIGEPFIDQGVSITLSYYPSQSDGGWLPGTPAWRDYQSKSKIAALNLINRFRKSKMDYFDDLDSCD